MKERTKFLIAVGVFFVLVGVVAGLIVVFGSAVLWIIPAIIMGVFLSMLAILAIEDYIVNPIGRWWFHKHGRRWDL